MEAVVIFDYTAENDDELTIQEGQIIREVIAIDDGWSEGRLLSTGEHGLFPCNFVEMRRAAPIEYLPPPVAPMEAVVLEDYNMVYGDVLSLRVGQVLKNVRKVDEDWAEGELLGKMGFFPSNFVKMREAVPEEHPPPPSPPPPPTSHAVMEAVAIYDYTAADDDELTFQEGQIIREVTVIDDGWSEGRLFSTGEYGMFPNNYVEMRRAAPIERPPPPVGHAVMEAVAIYDYTAADDDELTFQEGQIIREVTVIDDGWSEGRLFSTGEYGMFPNNYVEMRRAAPIERPPPPVESGRGKEEKETEEKKESLDVLKFQEQYSEVVRNQASVTLKITKCTTIGPPRIGKTCLKNLLIGQEWDVEAGTASTDVMEAPEWVECYSLEDDGAEDLWKLVSKEQQKGELIRAVNELTINSTQLTTPPSDAQNPTKPTDVTPPTDATATPSGTESRIMHASAHPPTSKRDATRKSATVRQALEALASACSSEALQDFLKDKQGKVLGKRRLIHFIDTGGQSIYHDIHPVLITSPSIYLVVFSLDDFQQKNDQGRLSYFRSDLIQRPLRSIYTFGRKNPEEKNLLQLQPEAPKIFIVGTHLDQIPLDGQEQFLERVDEMIEEEISSKPYHQFVQYDTEGRSFWAVDNRQAGKEQDEDTKEYISTLRLMVQDRSMEMSVQVPLPWMLLKMVMDGQGVRYCKYSQLLEEARSRGYIREDSPDADLDIMLRLFNALGLIYHKVPSGYKKEDSLVFIDPDCLYSATSDFLMAAMEEIECSQRGSEEGQIRAGTKDKTEDSQGGSEEGQVRAATKDETADSQGGSEEGQVRAATKDEMADSQGRSNVEKSPYQIYTHLTKPSMDLAGGKQQMESGLAKTQKPRQIPAARKILGGGVESMKVIQRISSSFNAFLSDMRTVLSSLERTVMNVGQDDTGIVLRSLKDIQKGVEEKNSLFDAANTLESKYRILAQEMVWKLMNSVRKVLQSSTSEDKKPKLDGIMEDFWCQCRMTRRSIDVDDFNHLLLLLTELRIIARLKQPDCYLIPTALPQLRDQIPVAGDIEPLLFTVISQDDLLYYLPSGLFCCLISELVTKLGWTVEPLGRTHVAFTHEDLTGVVHVVEHESYIEIKLESTVQVNVDCNRVREQIDERINTVYDTIYDPPESRREVVGFPETKRAVAGFKCNCGRGPAHAPHFAAYEQDKFESCVRCLLQGSTDVHMRPLTQQQLVWFSRPAVAGTQ